MRSSPAARAFVRLACCLPLVFGAVTAFASDSLDQTGETDQTGSPYFVVPGVDGRRDPLPLREVAVHADVSGVVAAVTVTQLWENTGDATLDGTYVFPLSTRAAVHALEMRVGGRRVVATIHKKADARAIYEDAKAAGKTATLLEQNRPNMFTTEVANIAPGDVIEVELSYVEVLQPTDGVYSLVIPKVVGPRYVSPSEAWPDIPWSVTASEEHGDRPAPVLYAWPVSVTLRGGVPVKWARSETHAIEVTRGADDDSGDDGDNAVEIELADEDADSTQDFVLDYALGGDALATGVLLQPDADGEGGHFLALVAPPERVDPALVPHRDYVFIVDTSGSMLGWPLTVAKKLVGDLVAGLDDEDRVNVLCFSGGSERLAAQSLPATKANKLRARRFLDAQDGGGGTELLGALETAFATPAVPGVARTFVVVTDGYVSVEAKAMDLIRAKTGDANVFAIGVGDGVNRHLIEAVAHAGQGESYVALDAATADDIAERLIDDVRAPVLTDIALRFDGVDAYDVEPASIPTLYATRPLLVTGRYRGAARGSLVVTGQTGQGAWRSQTRLAGGEVNTAVPLLWARERIARLSDFAGEVAGQAPDHKDEVTALGLEYALVTAFTSFVAVDEGQVAQAPMDPAAVEALSSKLAVAMGGEGSEFVVGHGAGGMGFTGDGSGGGGYGVGRIQGMGSLGSGGTGDSGTIGAKGDVSGAYDYSAPTPTVALSVTTAHGDRAPSDVLAVFTRKLSLIGRMLAAKDPLIAAQQLVWSVTIGSDGTVTAVSLARGQLTVAARQAITRALLHLRFAPRAAPETYALTLDLTLPSAGR